MPDVSALGHLAAAAGAVGAGIVNAVAGGGSLISFPVLTAVGIPSVQANATNTVALCPGYVGGTLAQRRDMEGLGPSLRLRCLVGAIGGLAGSILLVVSSEAVFRAIVPYLILGACLLLAVQPTVRRWVERRATARTRRHATLELLAVGAASVYGGYFGAGLGIMLVAVLGVFSDLPFNRLNAVKQLVAVLINVSAAVFLSFSGKVLWSIIAVMAPASLLGGAAGGRLASRLHPGLLRAVVIAYGIVVAIVYLLR